MTKLSKNIIEKIKKVKVLICDIDGVLTKGEIILSNLNQEIKIFNVKDGLALNLSKKFALKVVWLSGRKSSTVEKRAKELHIDLLRQGIKNKQEEIKNIQKKFSCKTENLIYIGDDLNDLSVVKSVGVFLAVKDGQSEVKKYATFVLSKEGGTGAVAEAIYLILKIQGKYNTLIRELRGG